MKHCKNILPFFFPLFFYSSANAQFIIVNMKEAGTYKVLRSDFAFIIDPIDSSVVSFSRSHTDGKLVFQLLQPLKGNQFLVSAWQPFLEDTLFKFDYIKENEYTIEYPIRTKKPLFTVYYNKDSIFQVVQNDSNLLLLKERINAFNEMSKKQTDLINQENIRQYKAKKGDYDWEMMNRKTKKYKISLFPQEYPTNPVYPAMEVPLKIPFFYLYPRPDKDSFFVYLFNCELLKKYFKQEKDIILRTTFKRMLYPEFEIDSISIMQSDKPIKNIDKVKELISKNDFLKWHGLTVNGNTYTLTQENCFEIEFKFRN